MLNICNTMVFFLIFRIAQHRRLVYRLLAYMQRVGVAKVSSAVSEAWPFLSNS